MRSVLFFIESLGRGGAERIFATFIENTKNKYDVFTETDGEVYTDIIKSHANHRCMVKKPDSGSKPLTFTKLPARMNFIPLPKSKLFFSLLFSSMLSKSIGL
jgi:hypothetical protein